MSPEEVNVKSKHNEMRRYEQPKRATGGVMLRIREIDEILVRETEYLSRLLKKLILAVISALACNGVKAKNTACQK